jgi:hypothetical protein
VCAGAADLLDHTPRNVQHLEILYRRGSAAGLAHTSRGRPPQPSSTAGARARQDSRAGTHPLRRLQRPPCLLETHRTERPFLILAPFLREWECRQRARAVRCPAVPCPDLKQGIEGRVSVRRARRRRRRPRRWRTTLRRASGATRSRRPSRLSQRRHVPW